MRAMPQWWRFLLFVCQSLQLQQLSQKRDPSMFEQRLIWETIMEKHESRTKFKYHLRVSPKAFNKPMSFIKSDMEVNGKQASRRGRPFFPELIAGVT
jgi:hypothetical protein